MPILINNKPIKFFKFPGGECNVNVLQSVMLQDDILIKAYLYNSDDLISLLLTVDACRRVNRLIKIHLFIPYFPYARQDRVCNQGESLSVKVIADLINSLKCTVTICDPHSDVISALLDNCTITPPLMTMDLSSSLKKLIEEENLIFISPDHGAEKRVREIAKYYNRPMLCATKVRDTKTGEIVKTELTLFSHPASNANVNFLIIDDICDGGRTFIEIAKRLREQGMIGNLYLYVTHGIFSKGLEVLRPYFKKVYCYHTFLPPDKIDPDFLEIIGETHAN